MADINYDVSIPAKLRGLYSPRRYKVLYGGRGGAKSHSVGRVLLDLAARRKLRILCAREVQLSMRDSVMRLLRDQITAMGLDQFFTPLETEIRGANGSLFLFAGLQQHTVDSIKSFEGVDIAWVEEAQSVSKRSWDILTPTIRAKGSEIWMTLNPDLDTDETYQRFVVGGQGDPDVWLCEINYRDNPWFPEVLELERQRAQRTMSKIDYENIWEGKARNVAEGAIYMHEMHDLSTTGRLCEIPYDPSLPVHTVWDLGWNDSMSISMVQKGRFDVRVIDYLEDSGRTLAWYIKELEKKPYRWGTDFLPHDGKQRDFKTGRSTEDILKSLGRRSVRSQRKPQDVEEGIKMVRMMFPRLYIDRDKAGRLAECLRRYRRHIPRNTGEPASPVHDQYSHGCLVAGSMVNTSRGLVPIEEVLPGDEVVTPAGYAIVLASGPTKLADLLVEIRTEDGSTLVATPEHRVFTKRGVVMATTIRPTDELFGLTTAPVLPPGVVSERGYRDSFDGNFARASGTRIRSVRRYVPDERQLVYDLTVEKHHCYFANGLLVSNSDNVRYIAYWEKDMTGGYEEEELLSIHRPAAFRPFDLMMGY